MFSWKKILKTILKVYSVSVSAVLLVYLGVSIFNFGYIYGFKKGQEETLSFYDTFLQGILTERVKTTDKPAEVITKEVVVTATPKKSVSLVKNVSWGGPELWEAVNKRRTEFGVNPLRQSDTLCTVAAVRLAELVQKGTLDGHEGFNNLEQRRPDLSEKLKDNFNTVAEFLLAGPDTAREAVALWENTLSHRKLLTAGEYVWGCIYAQNSFAVALAAF